MLRPMLERLRSHLQSTILIPREATVLVGYSGGADSTCLLHMLHRLEYNVIAAHLHHGMRPEAAYEEAKGEAWCQSLNIPFAKGKANVPQIAKAFKIGIEEAGRNARYDFFRRACVQLGCSYIATAHTLDDQVETVLFNLGRGAGLAGLAGIPAKRDNIIRPLLPFRRAETRAYCLEQGLWFHDDPDNFNLQRTRSRLREKVVPELLTATPNLYTAIERLAEVASEEDEFLNAAAARLLESAEVKLNGELTFLTANSEFAFRVEILRHAPPVLLKRAVRLAARSLGGSLDFEQTAALVHALQQLEKRSVTCEGGSVEVICSSEEFLARELSPVEPFRFPITVPGETASEEFGWKIEAFVGKNGPTPTRTSLDTSIKAELAKNLYFRSFVEGDRIQPLGMEGTRKVADILSEARLTLAARRRIPIICDMIGPVWVPGVCLAERAKPLAGSPSVSLRFGPISTLSA